MNYARDVGKDLGCARCGARDLALARPPADPRIGGLWTACCPCVEWLFSNAARLLAEQRARKGRGTP